MNKILQGDSLTKLKELPEKSINMCMTSPPYWALRDYGSDVETIWDSEEDCDHDFEVKERRLHGGTMKEDFGCSRGTRVMTDWVTKDGFCNKCGAWKGQLGLEPTFDLYIKHLCDIFDEVKRVLRDDGTCWVNLGDTYYGSGKGAGGDITNSKQVWGFENKEKKNCQHCGREFEGYAFQQFCGPACSGVDNTPREKKGELKDKCLTMIPFRFAIEMVNRGWILRNTIIWHKRNCMPSSVKDRFTVDFEYIFFFSKNKKYYFETQYEELAESSFKDNRKDKGLIPHKSGKSKDIKLIQSKTKEKSLLKQDNVPSKNSNLYEGFNKRYQEKYGMMGTSINSKGRNKRTVWTINPKPFKEAHFAVYPEELCETPIKAGCKEGGIVLDPFFGAGTTGLVALKQNKKFIGIELNKEYIEIANKRLKPYLEQKKLV